MKRFLFQFAIVALSPLTLCAQDTFELMGMLGAANQNGSDPAVVTDPGGIVPTDATGMIHIVVDVMTNTLDFSLEVDGISTADLREFGPNLSPIHLHLAGGGNPGNFGPIAIDLSQNAPASSFVDTANGFTFSRQDVSILLEDQGGVALGMHPGNDQIVDALQSGNMFVLVHTMNDIFTQEGATLPSGDPAPVGFPFGEIRGNVTVVPEPSAGSLVLVASLGLLTVRRRRNKSVA